VMIAITKVIFIGLKVLKWVEERVGIVFFNGLKKTGQRL